MRNISERMRKRCCTIFRQRRAVCFLVAFTSMYLLFTAFTMISEVKPWSPMRMAQKRWAYVFYVTSSDYACYAAINVHRLIFDTKANPRIDIILLATEDSGIDLICPEWQCPFPEGRVKIKLVSNETVDASRSLTNTSYYKECYIRFEAFGLYEEYDRVVIIDADGLIMRNIDHLFEMDMEAYEVAAALAYYETVTWISSIILIVDLSKSLYDEIKSYLNREQLAKVAAFHPKGAHFDMDILNYMFKTGNLTKLISKYYALLDYYFFENQNDLREGELSAAYYIHFSFRKPLVYISETRPRDSQTEIDSYNLTMSMLNVSHLSGFVGRVYYPFWKNYDKYCRKGFES